MSWLDDEKSVFLPVYKRIPVEIDHGEGVYLYDRQDRAYLDLLAGIAVNALGYNHPSIHLAINQQLNRNLHLSNYFVQDIQIQLADELLKLTPFSKLFFTNSGTEAIEGLLKLVKKWASLHNKHEIIAFEGSFHGRSLGALSITIQSKYQKNFFPLLNNVKYASFNSIESIEKILSDKTAAVFYEGITGEGGIHPVSREMAQYLKEARKRLGFLLIQDEIQTGIGRTGKFYHYEHTGLIPDAIATAKGLGGGLPLGAFLVADHLSEIFDPGEHGTTYGGNPLACATGLAVVREVSKPSFLQNVESMGHYFKKQLGYLAAKYTEHVREVRGKGLMLGIEVTESAAELMRQGLKNQLLFNIAGGNTLRFVPPLIMAKNHIDEAFEKLTKTFQDVFRF